MRFKTNLEDEYFFEEGCHIIEIMNDPKESALSFARARVEIGQKTKIHQLSKTTEYYYITQGQGVARVANEQYSLKVGDLLKIRPEEPQMIENTGLVDLIFICVCQPRFEPINYSDSE